LTALRYGWPARRLTVIAVTGTNGKSTVVSWIGQLLEGLGQPVGWVSTATISIKGVERLNETKLTTASPAILQRLLRRMVQAGCRYAVIEASSEGLAQGRLNGIPLRTAVFTNLTPEHVESHGSFENYAMAKERLFWSLSRSRPRPGEARAIVVNCDDPAAARFANYPVERVIGCTLRVDPALNAFTTLPTLRSGTILEESSTGTRFQLDGLEALVPAIGRFNAMNALEAVATVESLGFPLVDIMRQVPKLRSIPGRLELLDVGRPFRVLVDYAPEPASMEALYSVLPAYRPKRVIHVFGSCGGVRDHARRPVLGKWVAERADIAIVTNEDPYDEDPQKIVDEIMVGVRSASPKKAAVEQVLDRRLAIRKALESAGPGDLVVLTGKASEQWIVEGNRRIPWDDRRIVREEVDHLWKTIG
jgi:UDP-N-acetylmuramoyl-L-alanyl-D-glutamate--2,6-diaminopimelate ligase